jgi:hypothetical protein
VGPASVLESGPDPVSVCLSSVRNRNHTGGQRRVRFIADLRPFTADHDYGHNHPSITLSKMLTIKIDLLIQSIVCNGFEV